MAGIYLHIPFCKQACHYCDFHFSTSLKKKDKLIKALVKELELRKDELNDQTIETIYFGGGTPSLYSEQELQFILDDIYSKFNVRENPEITLEANPDDLSKDQITRLSKSSINRLSIGIQSFFDNDLKVMNRAHHANEAKNCLNVASDFFDNISIDLIYGFPDMSVDKWNENLEIAFSFKVPHISSYALTVEPKTALASFIKKGNYPSINDDLSLQHFEQLVAQTEKNGYVQYEVSNFGKEGFFSKHNTNYWKGKHYLGIGPSAHSFNGRQRSWNVANNSKYISSIENNILPNETEELSTKDQFNEMIMTGLRTIWGININKVESSFGEVYTKHLLESSQTYLKEGLLVNRNDTIIISKKGKFLADGIASQLFMI